MFSLDFNHEIIWDSGFLTLSGLSGLECSLTKTENGSGDGTVVAGKRYSSRDIVIKKRISWDNADYYQRYFESREHLLYIGKRRIFCICKLAEIDHRSRFALQPNFTLHLHCPDPYFYDVSDYTKNLAEIMPQFGFPWTVTKAHGISCGYRMYSDQTIFKNAGVCPVGMKVRFVARRGGAENFTIENAKTGQYVTVYTTLEQGEVLEISTVWGEKYVRKNGENIYDSADSLSSFFELAVGDNYLSYEVEEGQTNVDVYLSYSPKFRNALTKEAVR